MLAKLAPWSIAIGFLALAASLAWAFLAKGPETRRLGGETRSLRADLERAQRAQSALEVEGAAARLRHDAARRDANAAESEFQGVLLSDPRLAADFEALLADLGGRIAGLESEIEAARRAAEAAPPPRPPTPLPPPPAPREKVEDHGGRRSEAAARELEQRLERFRSAIALVISSGDRLATGVVLLAAGEKVYLLTISDAVPHGAEVKGLLRTGSGDEPKFQVVPCEVVLRDERSGLLLLEAASGKTSEFAALAEASFEGNPPAKGEAVYAIGAHAVGVTAFTGSVFEGIVSSIEEAPGGAPQALRLAMPMNEGAQGSLVVTADGRAAGILRRGLPNLDRISEALPAAAARPVLERLRRRVLGAAGDDPGGGPPERYPYESAVDLRGPLDSDAEVFPGPDDLVLIWERAQARLRAFRSGAASPVWEVGGDTWSSLTYRPWQPYGFLSKSTPPITVALNFRSGKPGSTLSGSMSQLVSRAWGAFPIGNSHVLALPQGIAIANLDSGRVFDLEGVMVTMLGHIEDLLTLTTSKGDIGWLTRGEFLTICARIDALHIEIEKLWREKMPDAARAAEVAKRENQIRSLAQQLSRGIKVFSVPGGIARNAARPGQGFFHVPGTYTHILGREVWQIGPREATRMGRIESLWHGSDDGSWERLGHSAAEQPCAMASPDGQYAVTATHIHDIQKLKAVAELPFPTGPAGFTSKGKTIYAYDRMHQRLVFLSLEEVLRGNGGPPPAAGRQ